MRIDRVDIRHFAGLSNISISFEQPFSLQYGKNETGKTTVMRFIRMMLYGSSALRLSCKPLSGEPMSGSLIFTQDSRHYQLDRVFGKSRRTDSITLTDLDTGTEQNLGSAEPGEMFLNLSEDTFVRSCFVGSLGSISGEKGSEEIRQRLQNLVSSGAEAVSVSEVEKRLTRSGAYHPEQIRHARSAGRKRGRAEYASS